MTCRRFPLRLLACLAAACVSIATAAPADETIAVDFAKPVGQNRAIHGVALRSPLQFDGIKDRGTLARVIDEGTDENIYRLQIMNATEANQRYRITAAGLPGLKLVTESEVMVESTQARWVTVRLQVPLQDTTGGSHAIAFEIESLNSPGHLTEKSVFLVPR